MNINICKVNTRYIILCVFVAFLFLTLFVNVKNTSAQTPTLNPTEAENKRRRDIHEQLEEARDRYVQTGISQKNYEEIKRDSTKQIWSIIGSLFWGVGQPTTTPQPGFIPPPGSAPLSPELQNTIPQGEPPAGACTDLVNRALLNLGNHPSNLEVYRQAGTQTGVPWEAIAAIHYIETGGSFNPNGSCISGRPIGAQEPDNGNQTYGSLLETCVAAAEEFKGKTGMVNHVVGKNGMPAPNAYQMLAGQFASYNAPTQSECAMGGSNGNYDFIYTGATWPGIPDNGQCRPKGEKYVGDRHIYATACLDDAHKNMWFHFHYGGRVQEYTNRVGAITLIRAIQKVYSQSPQNPGGGTPGPTYPPPSGFLRSPKDTEAIVNEANRYLSEIGASGITINNYQNILNRMNSAGERFKSRVRTSVETVGPWHVLQCVGMAYASSNEINGVDPQISRGYACRFNVNTPTYNFIPFGNSNPMPGDLIIWNSPGNICNSSVGAYGHIAYITEVFDPRNIRVAHANWGAPGAISMKNFSLDNTTLGFLRKK